VEEGDTWRSSQVGEDKVFITRYKKSSIQDAGIKYNREVVNGIHILIRGSLYKLQIAIGDQQW
jgi:hypothetical protein